MNSCFNCQRGCMCNMCNMCGCNSFGCMNRRCGCDMCGCRMMQERRMHEAECDFEEEEEEGCPMRRNRCGCPCM